MAAHFYPISRDEIHEFLSGLGFVPLTLRGVTELVYAKIVVLGQHHLSLRIYTAVDPDGESREKGTDAIRLQLFHRFQEHIVAVGRRQKCLRVVSWPENLRKALDRVTDPQNFRLCPACGHPMVIRSNKSTGEKFWACSLFRATGCRGKAIHADKTPPRSDALHGSEVDAKSHLTREL
jgi:hypothetical protein